MKTVMPNDKRNLKKKNLGTNNTAQIALRAIPPPLGEEPKWEEPIFSLILRTNDCAYIVGAVLLLLPFHYFLFFWGLEQSVQSISL